MTDQLTSPAIDTAKAACVHALPAIERHYPGDGGSLKVPYRGGFARVTCYHQADRLMVHVVKIPSARLVDARHYHIVVDESRP